MKTLDAEKIRARAKALIAQMGHGAIQSLADAAEIERMTLYRFLRGKAQSSDATLIAIANALDTQAPQQEEAQIDYVQLASDTESAGRYLLSVAEVLRSETATPQTKRMAYDAGVQLLLDSLTLDQIERLKAQR